MQFVEILICRNIELLEYQPGRFFKISYITEIAAVSLFIYNMKIHIFFHSRSQILNIKQLLSKFHYSNSSLPKHLGLDQSCLHKATYIIKIGQFYDEKVFKMKCF